jgi:hypothetical protein
MEVRQGLWVFARNVDHPFLAEDFGINRQALGLGMSDSMAVEVPEEQDEPEKKPRRPATKLPRLNPPEWQTERS